MDQVTIVKHPLVDHHLAKLRERRTGPEEFRTIVRRLAMLLSYEATQDLVTAPVEVQTPLQATIGARLYGRVGLIPILRAGLGMVDPIHELMPDAEVWHLGFYRDEATLSPVEYYKKLPASSPVDVALVLDPMLATGGSANAALGAVHDWGAPKVKLLSILAAPEGVEAVKREYPNTQIYVCCVDERLNDVGYIVPGLGDAGDRIFNTVTNR